MTNTHAPDTRRAIKSHIEDSQPTVAQVVNAVAADSDLDAEVVKEELDRMERAGFVYCVGNGVDAEVRLP